ncbi:MAG: HIT family protein [Deltaproteobacteria bacterium]|nr:HIT family protein [Deltaproteobacteria bacterium]
MQSPTDCIFCAIVSGRAAAAIVYRDEHLTAFLDLFPVVPGHLLIVPNRHAKGLTELDADAASRMVAVAQRLAAAVRRSQTPCEGINLFMAEGPVAGQTVFHCHLHLLPRHGDDGFHVGGSFLNRLNPGRDQLDALAASLRSALSTLEATAEHTE